MKNEKLWELNFNKLLVLKEGYNSSNYSFKEYERCNNEHPVKGFCTYCEQKASDDNHCHQYKNNDIKITGCQTCKKRDSFSLQNISHGTCADDFLEAHSNFVDTKGWHEEGVIFLMENPSKDYKLFDENLIFSNIHKRPAKRWYWIGTPENKSVYPQYFKGREYGNFFESAFHTFRLKNAYITNLVKCGMNNVKGEGYAPTWCYNTNAISDCFNQYLEKEIEALDTKIIFTFGSTVNSRLSELISKSSLKEKNIPIISLPHPAGQQRGFKHDYYQVLYFHLIMKGLVDAGIINDLDEINRLTSTFLSEPLWSQT